MAQAECLSKIPQQDELGHNVHYAGLLPITPLSISSFDQRSFIAFDKQVERL